MIEITLYTDPACPFAFSAEPTRLRLCWHYGDALSWRLRMIVLTLEPGEAEKLAGGARGLQAQFGMPIHPFPHQRPASSEPACRAVVAARQHAPGTEARLLRALRVRTMMGGLLDDPELIASAAVDAGIDSQTLAAWSEEPIVRDALAQDIAAARDPSPAARALDHKLGGPSGARRYTAPSYELRRSDRPASFALPGFNPVEAYEAAVANLAPELERRRPPAAVTELLQWAEMPLATAEVVAIMQQPAAQVRAELAVAAVAQPAGADTYWSLAG
ncbi:MAG: DsbA family oxidoreductase [Solirubrobacteraceae bacterium]